MLPPDLTIVLPTFNEAANIPVIVQRIAAALPDTRHEIIVVDDDSPDRTWEVALKLSRDHPHLRAIRRLGRRGLSGACVEGMMAASAPVIVIMDADLQHDETILPNMMAEIAAGADLVIGTRYAGGGSAGDGFSRTRARGSEWATALANRITGDMTSDPMSGFFMLTRATADRVAAELSGEGFKILFDILSRIGPQLTIREAPFTFRERLHGDSKLGLLVTLQFLGLLVSRRTGGYLPVRFLLFALVGFTGIFVHMAALFVFSGPLGLSFAVAQTGATLTAMTTNFAINNELTFAHRKLRGARWLFGLVTFMAVCSLGAIANVSVATQIHSFLAGNGWSVGVAGLAGALMSSVFNYSVTKLVTWKDG